MKVLHIIGNLDIGGAQSSLYHIFPGLRELQKEINVEFLVLQKLGIYGNKLRSEGALVHELNVAYYNDPTAVYKIRNFLKHNLYDLLHVHLFPELYIVPIASSRLKTRLIYTEHSSFNRRRIFHFPFRWIDALHYKQYERILAVSKSTKDALIKWQPQLIDKVEVLYNCVRPIIVSQKQIYNKKKIVDDNKISLGNDTQIILFAGRLSYVKGVDILIEALSKVELDYQCIIAGDGDYRVALEDLVKQYGLNDKVHFLGTRSDIDILLSIADVLILPSRWEGFPIVILEAMSAGCPIIASNVGGIQEIISDMESGILIPPNDSEALSRALVLLLKDAPNLKKVISKNAYSLVQNFSPESIAQKLLNTYKEILKR